jgi:two-component system CheB/CheR fusion protein
VVSFVDVTNLARAEEHQRILLAEVQHRTRNLLAVVQSIAKQTVGKGGSMGDFLNRLTVLGRVQNLISQVDADAIDLGDIVRLELAAHGGNENGNVHVDGPPVALSVQYVQTLALALHELATNAVKYGALKNENGKLDVAWTIGRDSSDNHYCPVN